MKVLRVICNILSALVIVVLIGLAGIFFVPKLMGGESLAVLSGSMTPKIPVGSIVVALPVDKTDIQVSDIVTYRLSESTLVTHRIESINDDGTYVTKGDANDVADTLPVPYENIVGKVKFYVPLAGYISIYIRTPLGIAGICGVIFVMLILLYLPEIFAKEEDKVAEPLDKEKIYNEKKEIKQV